MSRKAKNITRRVLAPDARYNSQIVAKLINSVMLRGQKATAEHIVYEAMQLASQRIGNEPTEALEQAINNATPQLMIKPRRVGGATYQVPIEVEKLRGNVLAMRWIISSARKRLGKSMAEKLASELVDTIQGQGATIKRRDDVHRMAEANKAFVHYRW
jgi:small subunit ribosomal protein S7